MCVRWGLVSYLCPVDSLYGKGLTMKDHREIRIIATRRDDTVASIAFDAPPLSEAVRVRLAQLLATPKPVKR